MVINAGLNLVLIFFVFVAVKNRPYAAAAIFAAVKTLVYYFLTKESTSHLHLSPAVQVAVSIVVGCIYAGVASAFIFFVGRLNKPRKGEEEQVPTYSSVDSDKVSFRWEAIPLIGLLGLLLVL